MVAGFAPAATVIGFDQRIDIAHRLSAIPPT